MRNAHLGQAARRCCCVFQVVVDNTKQPFSFRIERIMKRGLFGGFGLGVEEVREQAESTGSDGWLGSDGPLPQCGASRVDGRWLIIILSTPFFPQTRK
jgi:hypothetical protein